MTDPEARSPAVAHHLANDEETLLLDCDGCLLPAILHRGGPAPQIDMVVVVGGPQTRVGSHRQFVILARQVASLGIPVLRFDYRGMGDAEGEQRDFLGVSDDISVAVGGLLAATPGLEGVVLWGLCDGATAAALYAPSDPRVQRLVLVNPWVHSEVTEARAYLTRYYRQRLLSADFWRKFARGGVDLRSAVTSFLGKLWRAKMARSAPSRSEEATRDNRVATASPVAGGCVDLATMLGGALATFEGQTLVVTSGNDLTAAEFLAAARSNDHLSRALRSPRICSKHFDDADHTFSSHRWRKGLGEATAAWLR